MKNEIEIIGYFIQDGMIVVANPCSIPIEMLEEQLKSYKESKPKKGEAMAISIIKLPLLFKKSKKSLNK